MPGQQVQSSLNPSCQVAVLQFHLQKQVPDVLAIFLKGADAIRRLAVSLQAAGLVYIPENGFGKIETGLALLALQRTGFSDCLARGQAELMQWGICCLHL